MVFTRSRNHGFIPDFTLGESEFLEERQESTILGVQIGSSLSWESKVQSMVAKAPKTVWTLKRMKALGVDIPTLTQFWQTEGRVHLTQSHSCTDCVTP